MVPVLATLSTGHTDLVPACLYYDHHSSHREQNQQAKVTQPARRLETQPPPPLQPLLSPCPEPLASLIGWFS